MADQELNLALSPYALTAADPSAIAALLLGSRVVTMMPTPFGFAGGAAGREQVREAVELAPSYLRLMESWRWATPLWQAGVVRSDDDDEDMAWEVRRIWDRIVTRTEADAAPARRAAAASDPLSCLRGLMRPTLYRDEREYLELLCRDMLKGGLDPGIGIIVAAGVDAFSVRHGLAAVRTGVSDAPAGGWAGDGSGSVWQRAEATLCRRVFAVGVPVLLRASGRRILLARKRLGEHLIELRSAIAAAASACEAAPSQVGGGGAGGVCFDRERLTRAAGAYVRAFQSLGDDVRSGDDDEGLRVQEGYISITGAIMPADAALRSSLTAVRALAMQRGGAAARTAAHGAPLPTGAARLDGPAGANLFALIVRRMNIRPDPGAANEGAWADRSAASTGTFRAP